MTPPTKAELMSMMSDLNSAQSKLDQMISGYDDKPPLPVVRFAQHKYDNSTVTDIGAFDVYDLQPGYQLTGIPRPNSEMYLYATMCRRPSDPEGLTQFLKPFLVPLEQCCHTADGQLVRRTSSGDIPPAIANPNTLDTLINISDPSWKGKAISSAVRFCQASGATGLYLDEVDQQLSWAWKMTLSRGCKEFPTPDSWRKALMSFVIDLCSALNTAGLNLWINLGADSTQMTWVNLLNTHVDAVNTEFFVGREGVGQQVATVDNGWLSQVEAVAVTEDVYGRAAHVHCSSTKQSVVDYAFSSWLMATEFLGSFSASLDYGGRVSMPTQELVTSAAKLGMPLGAYGTVSTGYVRLFEHGGVWVNPFTIFKGGMAPMTGRIVLNG